MESMASAPTTLVQLLKAPEIAPYTTLILGQGGLRCNCCSFEQSLD